MARIIRSGSPARERLSIVAALRGALTDLEAAGGPDSVRDRLAYAGLALRELENSVERTIEAWERRGYWLKADQFRRDWGWAGRGAESILAPLLRGEVETARRAASRLLPHLPTSTEAARAARRSGEEPWKGAYARLRHDPPAGKGA
jgi:hypothetical protein